MSAMEEEGRPCPRCGFGAVSVEKARAMLDVSDQTVRNMVADGRLDGVHVDGPGHGTIWVSRSSLEKMIQERTG